jgi:hypothetical protein
LHLHQEALAEVEELVEVIGGEQGMMRGGGRSRRRWRVEQEEEEGEEEAKAG